MNISKISKDIIYDKEFSQIYNQYGWDYFSLTMGKSILDYMKINNYVIKSHIDLCCGTGVLCDFFYKNKIKTKGIDISNYMIEIAKSKNKNISFYVDDVLRYYDEEKYDLVTMTCDAVNHLINNDDLDKLFSNINSILNNDGYFIFDVYDNDKIKLNFDIVSKRDNNIDVHYFITNQNDSLINTNVKIKKDNKLIYEKDVIEKLYDVEYIKKLLLKYNFTIIQIKNKILNENYIFKDKLYVICKKNK